VHGALKVLAQFSQVIQIKSVVFVGEETGGAVVTALNNVPGNAG